MEPCPDEFVHRVLDLAQQLHAMADEAEGHDVDDGCAVLCGVMRDSAFQLRRHAERELLHHRARGIGGVQAAAETVG